MIPSELEIILFPGPRQYGFTLEKLWKGKPQHLHILESATDVSVTTEMQSNLKGRGEEVREGDEEEEIEKKRKVNWLIIEPIKLGKLIIS